ncbi:MAG: TonB-dependent receptor [Asticcacaulis sp.]
MTGRIKQTLWLSASLIVLAATSQTVSAETSSDDQTSEPETIVVTGVRQDPLRLLQTQPTDSLTGLDLSLLETPRSASRVSAETISRLGMQNVDDLIAAVPGAFTASFFGVPGNLNVRGTLADTYFQGFKRIENRGSFSSNLGAAAQIEVLRGPPSAIYGPGKVGGLLNFVPKSARGETTKYVTETTGGTNVTAGSYGKLNVAGDVTIPLGNGGLSIYVEREDSGSYYRNVHPEHLNVQTTYVGDIGNWNLEVNAMYFEESGRIQSPGWNRVTQDLIDNGTYIMGRDTDIADLDGSGYLEYSEIDAALGTNWGTSNIRQIREYGGANRPEYALDEGVGTTKLSGRNILATDGDYNDTETFTAYAGLSRRFDNGSVLAFKGFVDKVANEKFNSFGFAADYSARAAEARVTYSFPLTLGTIKADTIVGAGYRDHTAKQYESFLSGYIGNDRRDLSYGATATDKIASPLVRDGAWMWDTRLHMDWDASSVFMTSDIALTRKFKALISLRYDDFNVQAINTGATVFGTKDKLVKNSDGATTWSASLRYEFDNGLTPYVTVAEPRSLESTQTGGVSVGSVQNNLFISPSKLTEAGVKFSVLEGNLFGGLAWYEQYRRQTDLLGNVSGTTSEGFELEAHWLATNKLSVTGTLTLQETMVDAPGAGKGEYLQIRPEQFGISNPALAYGGIFAINNAGTLLELRDGYKVTTMPDTVASLFGTYTSDFFPWGSHRARAGVTGGLTYVSETGGIMKDSIRLPEYTLARVAGFVRVNNLTFTANIDNLFDERYFTPSAEVYKEVAVMPGLPRTFRINVGYRF